MITILYHHVAYMCIGGSFFLFLSWTFQKKKEGGGEESSSIVVAATAQEKKKQGRQKGYQI